MDSSFAVFDDDNVVKAKSKAKAKAKAKAMESYNNNWQIHRTLKNFMLLLELCLGLVTLSWLLSCVFTWIPLAVQIAAGHLSASFRSSLCVFLFCNAMILLIAFLSTLDTSKNSSASYSPPDLYDEFVATSEARRRSSSAPEDKHIVHSSNYENASSSALTIVAAEKTEKTERALVPQAEEAAAVVPAADSPAKVYQRTQSCRFGAERIEKRSGVKELRRWETENGREMVRYGGGEAVRARKSTVEDLSSEEFRLKIEAFIAAQKCNQMKEHKCTAIAVRD